MSAFARWVAAACVALSIGCDDSDPAEPGTDAGVGAMPEPGPFASRFTLDAAPIEAGDWRDCAGDTPIDARFADWAELHVDPAGAEGGDGGPNTPFRTIAEALQITLDDPVVLRLAPGVHQANVEPTGPVAVVGRCAAEVRIEGRADAPLVRVFGVEHVHFEGVHLVGGRIALDVQRVRHVTLTDVRLSASTTAAVRLRQVERAVLDGSAIRDQVGRGIVALDSAVALVESRIGPDVVVGVVGGFDPDAPVDPDDCAAGSSPVCPLSSALVVERSHLIGNSLRGLDVTAGAAHLRESLIEEVRPMDGEAIGVRLEQSWFLLDDGVTVRAVDGLGVALDGSRGLAQGARILANARGGIAIGQGQAGFPRPSWDEAGPGWRWPQAWLPADGPFAAGGLVEFPGWEWLPAPDADLPPAFRRDSAAPSPALLGHRWARATLRDLVVEGNGIFGIRAEQHVVEVDGGVIRGTTGANSAALVFGQVVDRPASDAEASAVALSSVSGTTIEGNEGLGVVSSRAALFDGDAPWTAVGVRLSEVDVRSNANIGVALLEGVASVANSVIDDNAGVGLWSAGSFATVSGTRIEATRSGLVPGREGAVEAGDGLVVQGTARFAAGSRIEVADTQVLGSARAGVLVVADEPEFPVTGRLDFDPAAVSENATDGVILGANEALAVDGVELAVRDATEVPPPALPLPGQGE